MSTLIHPTAPAAADFHNDKTLPCRRVDRDLFFPPPDHTGKTQTEEAKAVCSPCHRRADCLRWALDTGEVNWGIVAGYTPAERRRLLRRRQVAAARPDPPARVPRPFGWGNAGRLTAAMLRRRFAAAAHYIANGGDTVSDVSDRFGLARTVVQEAVTIRMWAPDLVAAILDGWIPFGVAYTYAQSVCRWAEGGGGQ